MLIFYENQSDTLVKITHQQPKYHKYHQTTQIFNANVRLVDELLLYHKMAVYFGIFIDHK